jgi:signal transduction histidine kinase
VRPRGVTRRRWRRRAASGSGRRAGHDEGLGHQPGVARAPHAIEVDVSIDLAHERGRASTRHTPELETAIYRIVQEALTNATKHGGARRAVVEIVEDDETVHLEIRDDGAGFDPAAETDGFGLLGMRERVELLDGALLLDSTPGRGTTVRASFPVQRRAVAALANMRDTRNGS